CQQVYSNPFTF
nr:immunoglobulin light chain junction region [Macaca mulatta]MOV78918.1 immunoglobulin light chain junction region [Macaca mulatta]MOV80527.1 immunoglobulin light chain junction region [Macaca mulatta]MOV83444.1 immunoglobulin light chain junction region [Macaca mulatta]MOV84138.1 immunoglobulin light chain junction region [Macaca mulatta]